MCDGPDIGKIIKDVEFINSINNLELRTWTSFVDIVKNFEQSLSRKE